MDGISLSFFSCPQAVKPCWEESASALSERLLLPKGLEAIEGNTSDRGFRLCLDCWEAEVRLLLADPEPCAR